MKNRCYIARDKNGSLYIYENKPSVKSDDIFTTETGMVCQIESSFFPEVTFENSPKVLNVEGPEREEVHNKNK